MRLLLALVVSAITLFGGLMSATAQDANQMRAETIAPVVRIDAKGGIGSGTVIYSAKQANGQVETYILTNNHVIEESITKQSKYSAREQKTVTVEQADQVKVDQFTYNDKGMLITTVSKPAIIVAHDEAADLAVVKLVDDVNVLPTTTVTKDDSVAVYDPVIAVGAGLGNPPFPTTGIISQTDTEMDGHRFLQVSSPIIMGNSGGALFRFEVASGHYELIGVPSAVSVYGGVIPISHMAYAIPASTVRAFLGANDLGFIVG